MRDRIHFLSNEAPHNAVLQPIEFASKSLTSVEIYYYSIEKEALGILLGQEYFQPYCFTNEIRATTDHNSLVAIFKKDVASLSHIPQRILL